MNIGLQIHMQNRQQIIHDQMVRHHTEIHKEFMRRIRPTSEQSKSEPSEEFQTKFKETQDYIAKIREEIKADQARMRS